MREWHTSKPTGDVIFAELISAGTPRHAVLFYRDQSQQYYTIDGEAVPDSDIIQWTPIEPNEEDYDNLEN